MRYVYGTDGNVVASIDALGRVTLGADAGEAVGLVRDADVYSGEAGNELLGRLSENRRVVSLRGEFVGSVDANGRVSDPTGRIVGAVDEPVDGAALLLLVAPINPQTIAPPTAPADSGSTIMDEVMSLSEENAQPGIRKNYKPLTDDDVFGTPYRKE